MKLIISLSLLLVSQLSLRTGHAQHKNLVISGKVVAQENAFPLEGVNIRVKGTRTITGTMYDGTYALEIDPQDSILVFTLEGYESQEIKITRSRKDYDVVLKTATSGANRYSPTGLPTTPVIEQGANPAMLRSTL